jgi:hypothetical protein
VENRQFLIVSLRPMYSDSQVTGPVIGLPSRDKTPFIALWNSEDEKQFITGTAGNFITKIHCCYGSERDSEEIIAFYTPSLSSDGKIDLIQSRQIMKKSVALVGALFKKLIKSSNVNLDAHGLIEKADIDKIHTGMPDYDYSESSSETERKRIENQPFTDKKVIDIKEKREEKKEEKKEEFKTENLPATTHPHVRTYPGQNTRHTYPNSTYKYDSKPTWFSRRPNQHVHAKVARLGEELSKLKMEKEETVRKTTTTPAGSAAKAARRMGGAAGTVCAKCYHSHDCNKPIPYKIGDCESYTDRDEMLEIYGYGCGMMC